MNWFYKLLPFIIAVGLLVLIFYPFCEGLSVINPFCQAKSIAIKATSMIGFIVTIIIGIKGLKQ